MISDLPDICLVGGTGVGKSSAARLLQELGYVRGAFAGVAEHPHPGSVRSVAVSIWGDEALNDREKLVKIGNACREVDPDVWLRNLVAFIDYARTPKSAYAAPPVVVDDARRKNEYYGLKERGFVTIRLGASLHHRVDRLKANGKWLNDDYLDDEIEHELDDEPTDYTVWNDDSIDDLYEDIVGIVLRERKRR